MWQHLWSFVLIVAFASSLTIGHGFLLLGPKFLRSNQDYTVVMSNFDSRFNDVIAVLKMEGHTDGGAVVLNLTETAVVRSNSNTMVNFKIPPGLPVARYKISMQSKNDASMNKIISLDYLEKTVTALVQLNKPVFKPGDSVLFRVIMLDSDLMPPAGVTTVQVSVKNPDGIVMRRWAKGRLHVGVFEGDLQIPSTPQMGQYSIEVKSGDDKLTWKTFEVKEYVLSKFDIEIFPTIIPLLKHQALSLTVAAKFYAGLPAVGKAKVQLYLVEDELDQTKEIDLNGKAQMALQFNEPLHMYGDEEVVRVNVTITQKYTNLTIWKEQAITVYKHQYKVQLIRDRPLFSPGMPFSCTLRVQYQDGTPAKRVTVFLLTEGIDGSPKQRHTTDGAGLIKLNLRPSRTAETIYLSVTIDDVELLDEDIGKQQSGTAFIKVELKSTVEPNNPVRLAVTCNEEMPFFFYYVVSKRNIVDTGFIRPNRATTHDLLLHPNDKWMPKAKFVVGTVVNNVVFHDFIDIFFEELRNNFNLKITEDRIKPGAALELRMTGRPGSYVALAAFDQSLLQHSKNHDLFWENIVETFDGFHASDENIFDYFHSIGLFARTFGGLVFDVATDPSRTGSDGSSSREKLVSFRTNFLESFLWKNVTIGPQGTTVLKETAPDSTTAWHLTGFSMDPMYGLGIVKKPIEFTTVQQFYIVESLPYSIKRGEAVVLQFLIVNNYPQKYKADVTLYNVDNQTEFIGRSVMETSYTKSVNAPANGGVPVSFLVKSRKLGEMVVRVQAVIPPATDTIELVVRVVPESLVEEKRITRFFSHNTYTNKTYALDLPMDEKMDAGSKKTTFSVTTNLMTSVVNNLESLLSVATGCGEQNMVRLVPNLVVLDYLNAIGSKEERLIGKATTLLRQGYQNQLKYRQKDGSYGVWGSSGGSVFLTAFVGKSLLAASKYLTEVDSSQVAKLYDWLALKQHSTGRFDEVGKVIHKDMQGGLRNGIALTSYVLIAFLEHPTAAKQHSRVVDKGIKYVTNSLRGIADSYDLSIATYALMLHGHSSKDGFLEKLVNQATVRNNGSEMYWDRSSASIETTAYALLSFVVAEKYIEGTTIMRWLVNQRYTTGSFPRSQDTCVGLKALTKLAEKISPTRNDYSIQVRYANIKKEFRVTSQDLARLSHDEVVDNIANMQATVSGIGFGMLEMSYEYSVALQNFADRFDLQLESTVSRTTGKLVLRVCASYIPLLPDSRSNMALVEVSFPSGYVVDTNPISKPTIKENPIMNTEIRFGATSVVVYYNNMGTERNCFTVTAHRRAKVALKRAAFVLVHDYYDPKQKALKTYEVDSDGICDVCELEDCPSNCKK